MNSGIPRIDGKGDRTWPIRVFATLDSTNEAAKEAALGGDFGPCWYRAETQTSGRGRQGRSWASPPGNLYASALFSIHDGHDAVLSIPFVAALAVAETTERLVPGSEPKLKWPNDVRLSGRKISGILAETGACAGTIWVVVGIGINVTNVPDGIDQAATSVASERGDGLIDAAAAMEVLAARFAERLSEARAGFSAIRSAWLERADGLGGSIRVRAGQGDQYETGVFEDMAEDGSLILRLPDGSRRPIRAGDVELVRRA
ncbi:MAG: biotin--[acetyl-CoA-carboxylase] ligase [Pseudomonadota bacterium]